MNLACFRLSPLGLAMVHAHIAKLELILVYVLVCCSQEALEVTVDQSLASELLGHVPYKNNKVLRAGNSLLELLW